MCSLTKQTILCKMMQDKQWSEATNVNTSVAEIKLKTTPLISITRRLCVVPFVRNAIFYPVKISWKCIHTQYIQDVDEIVSSSREHQWILWIKWWIYFLQTRGFLLHKFVCGLLWCFYQLFGLCYWRHPFTVEQGCPTLLLAIDCPAKFSSN